MLQKIRHATDSIIFRLFLGVLVLSFAIWGISDVVNGPSAKVIATFSDIAPITQEDFAKSRAIQIKKLQQESEQPLSDEQIKSMGIDQLIVQNLVTNKLFEFLGYKFDVDFSNAVIADFIRRLKVFTNDNNEFDIDKFKSFLYSQNISEDEYSNNVKDVLARDIIMSSLVGNAYIPAIRTNNIISHMSEIRKVDVASISLFPKTLSAKGQNISQSDFTEEELKDYYKENSTMFKTDEVRDICYAKLDANSAKANITISDSEVQSYFNENKDEFVGKKLEQVKTTVKSKLQKQKTDEWIIKSSKALEDEVAGGSTLQEITTKYGLKKICEKNISTNNIETRAEGLFLAYTSALAELGDKQLSYPLDLPQGNGQILLEIARLEPEHVKEFDQVKDKVAIAYASFQYKQKLLKQLQDFASGAGEGSFIKDAGAIGMSTAPAKDYIRANLTQNVEFPPEMLVNMFAASKGKIMGPFITDDNAYLFVVRSVGYDNKTQDKITKSSQDKVANKLREGIFEELMIYTTNITKMKLNANFTGE